VDSTEHPKEPKVNNTDVRHSEANLSHKY